MIYTSNYARKGNDPNAIAISVGLKEWNKHLPQLKQLAPTWDMVMGNLSHAEYTRQYIALLEEREFDPQKFLAMFDDNEDYFLLCYEPPSEFCHRRVLAEYIEQHTGVVIPEWKNPKEQEAAVQQEVVDELLQF